MDATTIDAAALGREAAATAQRSVRPVALEPGDYPVVLAEYAVVDILDMLGYLGFSALAVEEGRSFFEPGRRVGSELVTIRDDASDPAGLPASFDYEGVACEPVVLVEAGVCRDVVWDSATAAWVPVSAAAPVSVPPATGCRPPTRGAPSRSTPRCPRGRHRAPIW